MEHALFLQFFVLLLQPTDSLRAMNLCAVLRGQIDDLNCFMVEAEGNISR